MDKQNHLSVQTFTTAILNCLEKGQHKEAQEIYDLNRKYYPSSPELLELDQYFNDLSGNSSLQKSIRVFLFNVEHYLEYQLESQAYLMRLPIIHCGLPIEHFDYQFQRDLRVRGRQAAEQAAWEAIASFKPDVVVCGQFWNDEDLSIEFFHKMQNAGIKIIGIIWDGYRTPLAQEIKFFLLSDCLVYCASVSNYLRFRLLAEMYGMKKSVLLCMGCYYIGNNEESVKQKIFDVTMLGSYEKERIKLLNFLQEKLKDHNIILNKFGGLVNSEIAVNAITDKWISWNEYFRTIRQSKICLNSQTDPGRLQIQGKIFEIIGRGTFCMTDEHPDARKILPSQGVCMYKDYDDCLEKILYYLKNEDERESIAAAGNNWFNQYFSYKSFWSKTLIHVVHGTDEKPFLPFLEVEYKKLKDNLYLLCNHHLESMAGLMTYLDQSSNL